MTVMEWLRVRLGRLISPIVEEAQIEIRRRRQPEQAQIQAIARQRIELQRKLWTV
jgi:hypothetical protein